MLKAAALEVTLKLLLNIPRQIGFLRFEVLLERRVIFVNDLIEERPLRAVAHIDPCTHVQTGFPASG